MIKKCFLFSLLGILFFAAPNLMCAAAPAQDATTQILADFAKIAARDFSAYQLPPEFSNLSSKPEDINSFTQVVAFEDIFKKLASAFLELRINESLHNIDSLLAHVDRTKESIDFLALKLNSFFNGSSDSALWLKVKVNALKSFSYSMSQDLSRKKRFIVAKTRIDRNLAAFRHANPWFYRAYEGGVSSGEAFADGFAKSEAFTEALGQAAQNFVEPCVDGFQRAARAISEEFLNTIKRSNADIQEAGKTVKAFVDGISNATSFGLLKIGASLGLLATGGVTIWLGAREVRKYLDKPSIIKETNIPTIRERLGQLFSGRVQRGEVYPKLNHVTLNDSTLHALQRVKLALQGAKKRGGTFTNCLFWGVPGTGKTMSAQALANEVDCYWMKLSGSALMQLSRGQAIQEIDAMFEFASRQSKPVVIIIDEADPMFEKRTDSMDRDTMAVMSHFMEKTGTKRNDIMFIAITNRPHVFDKALLRRFPDQIEIALPGVKERYAILRFNVCRLLQKKSISIDAFTEELYQEIAAQTEGMSGSDIENFVIFLYEEYNIAREISSEAELTQEMVKNLLADFIRKKNLADNGFTQSDHVRTLEPSLKVA